jgi:hypothetical protein
MPSVIEAIQDRHKKQAPLAWMLVRGSEPHLVEAAELLFGSWAKAIEAAGLSVKSTYYSSQKYF